MLLNMYILSLDVKAAIVLQVFKIVDIYIEKCPFGKTFTIKQK